jgi:hypothetical protein
MTRRSLIQRVLALLGIDAAVVLGCVSDQAAERGAAARMFPSSSRTAPLSSAEMDDLLAFGERLISAKPLAPDERRYLAEHIDDWSSRDPWYLSLYRVTARTLEQLAGRRFASLEVRDRADLISRYRLDASRVRPGEDLGPFPAEIRLVRTRAAPDLIAAYYGSPAGWAVVGYQTFPGRCGDLTRYTRAEV